MFYSLSGDAEHYGGVPEQRRVSGHVAGPHPQTKKIPFPIWHQKDVLCPQADSHSKVPSGAVLIINWSCFLIEVQNVQREEILYTKYTYVQRVNNLRERELFQRVKKDGER